MCTMKQIVFKLILKKYATWWRFTIIKTIINNSVYETIRIPFRVLEQKPYLRYPKISHNTSLFEHNNICDKYFDEIN